MRRVVLLAVALLALAVASLPASQAAGDGDAAPYVVVLGIAQDGGVPQAGSTSHPGWSDPTLRRRVVSLGIVEPSTRQRWMIEATPDFRDQLHVLDQLSPVAARPGLDGIFLTHAHMGHYTGLMFLGHESLGAVRVPVYAMPRMATFITRNGPWGQLVAYENIVLRPLRDGQAVALGATMQIVPFAVPHRQEYSEVVGFEIRGPSRTVLFLPDIDSWEQWDDQGTRIEDRLRDVDVAYLDATFYGDGEIPGRDMSGFPHPFITHSLSRLGALPAAERAKVRFIHLNHTNPALDPDSAARRTIEQAGFRVAAEGERVGL